MRLTRTQDLILDVLENEGGSLRAAPQDLVRAIAARAGRPVDVGTLRRNLRRLERATLVVRRPDASGTIALTRIEGAVA
jgi:DNA-binding MarR family transcriptional regulator